MSKKQEEWLRKQLQSNLFFQLRQLEILRPENWNSPQRDEHRRLTALLKARNHEPKIAKSLYGMADTSRSIGAARALRGTPVSSIIEQAVRQVVFYTIAEPDYTVPERPPPQPKDGETPIRWPSYAMPLALGESDEALARIALIKALRFRAKKREEVPIDISFRRGAAESLGTIEHDDCRRALLGVLTDSRDNLGVREGCREVLCRLPLKPELLAPYQWLKSTSERQALKRLACDEVGWLRAKVTSLSRFRQVREDLLMVLEQPASPKPLEPRPRYVPPNNEGTTPVRQAPQTPPTKAPPVAPAPPVSRRQPPGERPKTGSDEGDSREPQSKLGFCEQCQRQLNEEGLFTPEQLEELEPVAPQDCVRCSIPDLPG